MNMPYEPREDTFLLIDCLSMLEKADVGVEVGCGKGVVLKAMLSKVSDAVGTDIDAASLIEAKRQQTPSEYSRVHLINAHVLPLRPRSVNVIVSNPPYLPVDEEFFDPTIHGGPTGTETAEKVVEAAAKCLKYGGRLVLLVSSLGDVDSFFEKASAMGFRLVRQGDIKLFFEKVHCFIFTVEKR